MVTYGQLYSVRLLATRGTCILVNVIDLSNKCLLGSDKYGSTLLAMSSQEVPQDKKEPNPSNADFIGQGPPPVCDGGSCGRQGKERGCHRTMVRSAHCRDTECVTHVQ